VLAAPDTCPYLPDRVSRMRYELAADLTAPVYMTRVNAGWRRFGPVLFRHECPSCRSCQSLRVPVHTFMPSASQRRAWRKNADAIEIRVGGPSATREKVRLFRRFHEHGHAHKGWPSDAGQDLSLFTANPFRTEEWTFHLADRLVAVGYVDVLPEGLSAIYFFHDPEESQRSLGTFNILAMIESARTRQLPYLHLGYFVAGCRSLEYKGRFRPNEVLDEQARWVPFLS
jgi:arginyl-tRNA--protein-N-Asp/Glu arginylyltransferase